MTRGDTATLERPSLNRLILVSILLTHVMYVRAQPLVAFPGRVYRAYLPSAVRRISFTPQAPVIEIGALPAQPHVDVRSTAQVNAYDPNGEGLTVSVTQQLGMGDRYVGTEYVTAQPLDVLTLDGTTLAWQARYPGNYRIAINARDSTGNVTVKGVDIPIGLAFLPGYPVRAMSLGGLYWPERALSQVDDTLDRMLGDGVNHIALAVSWYVDDYTDSTIEPWYRQKPGFPASDGWFFPTLSDDEVRGIVRKARQRGMGTILKLHVEALDSPHGGKGTWALAPVGGNWDGLFQSYTQFVLHYAAIAEQEGVDILVIGVEKNSMTDPGVAGVDKPDRRWRDMIAATRCVYGGQITYSANLAGSYDETYCYPCTITFWDALDLIGFELYKGLTRNNLDPSVAQLQQSIGHILSQHVVPLAQRYGKRVLIPEINFYSFDGVNTSPIGASGSHPPDWDEQARLYTAVLQELSRNPAWFQGIVWWAGFTLSPEDDLSWLNDDDSDWIWTKPVESVLRAFWTAPGVAD
jgi:hypothetical protein